MTDAITLKVWPLTAIGGGSPMVPAKPFNIGWRHERNDLGSGQFSVFPFDTGLAASPAMSNYGNVVVGAIDGVDRFAWLIEPRALPLAPPGENAEKFWTFQGRGVLALLEDARVYPDAPIAQLGERRDRVFGYMSKAYDASAWTNAVDVTILNNIYRWGTLAGGSAAANGFPDATARWIWSRAFVTGPPSAPLGTSYFRKTFTLASAARVTMNFTCDDVMRLWVDGELVFDNTSTDEAYPGSFPNSYDAAVQLLAGNHIIAVEVTNLYTTLAGLLMAVYVDGVLSFHTDTSWKCLDYPANPPGMTVGQIMNTLITEAKARGCFPGVTTDFTTTLDSAGAAWTSTPIMSWPIGTMLIDVLRTLMEQYVDSYMTTALVLRMFKQDTLGTDRSGSVNLLVGTHFISLSHQGAPLAGNVALIATQDGGLFEFAAGGSPPRRKEMWIEAGTATTQQAAQGVASAAFMDHSLPSAQLAAQVFNAGAYTGWTVGDLITLPKMTGGTVATRVLALTVGQDPDTGRATYTIEAMQDDN